MKAKTKKTKVVASAKSKSASRSFLGESTTQSGVVNDLPIGMRARWRSIRQVIEDTNKGAQAASALTQTEKDLFECHLYNLVAFAWRMLNRFAGKVGDPLPETKLNSTFALNLILNQVEFDTVFMQQAIMQRMNHPELLRKADDMAETFLQPAVNAGWFEASSDDISAAADSSYREPKPIVMTYLRKSPLVRMMPYSPIAFVALPMTAVGYDDGDPDIQKAGHNAFLSLAHEIGHLVFWKGTLPERSAKFALFLNREVQRKRYSPFIANGVEEIVADMYGAILVGLPMLYTSQNNAAAHQRERYYAGNARYMVAPELRPYIYEQVCAKKYPVDVVSKAASTWATDLPTFYGSRNSLGEFNAPATIEVEDGNGYSVGYNAANDEIQKIVDYLYPLMSILATHAPSNALSKNLKGIGMVQTKGSTVTKESVLEKSAEELGSWLAKKIPERTVHLGDWMASPSIWDKSADGEKDNWQIWAEYLMNKEREQAQKMKEAGLSGSYADADPDWFTMLYSGGWVLESNGNTGPPKR